LNDFVGRGRLKQLVQLGVVREIRPAGNLLSPCHHATSRVEATGSRLPQWPCHPVASDLAATCWVSCSILVRHSAAASLLISVRRPILTAVGPSPSPSSL